MATVPGVMILGDYQVNGGNTGIRANTDSIGGSTLRLLRDMDAMRIIPDNGTTGASTAATLGFWPWYDGHNGTLYTVAASPAPTSTTITVTPDPGWTTNEWAGRAITICNASGIGFESKNIVQSNTSDTLTVGAFSPVPTAGNPVFVAEGAFTDYHPNAGHLAIPEVGSTVSARGGSTYYAFGNGIGLDAGLIRYLWENVWTNTPYFHVFKYAQSFPTVGGWQSGGTARTVIEAEMARVAAAFTTLASGHDLEWQYVFLDNSQQDVIDWATTPANALSYVAAVQDVVTWLRGATMGNNANLRVILANHDPELYNTTTPAGTAIANGFHNQVATADSLVRTVSFEGLRLRGTDAGNSQPQEEREFYAGPEYWGPIATKVGRAIEAWELGTATTADNGLPAYIYIGDSICVGPISEVYLTELGSLTITAGQRPDTQLIWSRTNQAAEAYDAATNSNTSGTVNSIIGPECSMMVDLESLHPNGFVLLKRGSNGSSMVHLAAAYSGGNAGRWSKSYAETEHYGELVTDWEGLLQYCNDILGKQVDLRGVFVDLGTNDGGFVARNLSGSGGGQVFADELPVFVNDLRTDFSTRTDGEDLAIVWRLPQLATDLADEDETRDIRDALRDFAATDARFRALNMDDLERWDGTHETDDASIEHGQRFVAAMAEIAV